MKHLEFQIGLEFSMSGNRWRCTDVGTRTIAAIKLEAPDPSWFNGPPYAIALMRMIWRRASMSVDKCAPPPAHAELVEALSLFLRLGAWGQEECSPSTSSG